MLATYGTPDDDEHHPGLERFARRHAGNPRFSFDTGKLGDLAGFASAVLLPLIALLIGWESLVRLSQPIHIDFNQAITVAIVGLIRDSGSMLLDATAASGQVQREAV